MAEIPKGKVGLAKGVVKSLITLDVPNLLKNFLKKPFRSTVKTALAGTGAAGVEGAVTEIFNQLKSGKPDLASIVGKTYGNIVKRGAQLYSGTKKFGKKIKKAADLNQGGMAYARKKNMGLKMNAGGSVGNKKSRGTGAAIKGTKFKGIF